MRLVTFCCQCSQRQTNKCFFVNRGAVSLALALDVKVTFSDDEERNLFGNKTAFYTSVVVILTLVVNAPLTAPLLNWLSRQKGYCLDPAQVRPLPLLWV